MTLTSAISIPSTPFSRGYGNGMKESHSASLQEQGKESGASSPLRWVWKEQERLGTWNLFCHTALPLGPNMVGIRVRLEGKTAVYHERGNVKAAHRTRSPLILSKSL